MCGNLFTCILYSYINMHNFAHFYKCTNMQQNKNLLSKYSYIGGIFFHLYTCACKYGLTYEGPYVYKCVVYVRTHKCVWTVTRSIVYNKVHIMCLDAKEQRHANSVVKKIICKQVIWSAYVHSNCNS